MSNQKLKENEKTPNDYKESLINIIKKEGFITYNIVETKLALTGGSFLGTLHEVDVKGKTENGDKEINIFVKQTMSEVTFDFLPIDECYDRECFVYKELLKIYNEIQDSANIPADERFKFAKCFEETTNKYIILENLTSKGYQTPSRMSVFPIAIVELSIKQMAKFHSLSIVLEKRMPEYFAKNIKTMKTTFKMEGLCKFAEHMLNISNKYLNEESYKILEATLFKSYKDDIRKIFEFTTTPLFNCFCHGDYKSTNVMYKDIDGEIVDVIPVDFQCAYYGNPIGDFMYFIIFVTDREFRQKHLENLKDLYYETMKDFLNNFHIDLDLLFPRKEFENQYRDTFKSYLLWAIMGLPIMLASEDYDLNTKEIEANDRINRRLQEIFDESIEWGVI